MMHYNNTNFLRDHSLKYIEMALKTDRIERVANPDGYGKRIGDCGDTVEFFLTCKKNILQSISFCVQGCMNTTACCNTVARFAQGKTIESAWNISPDQVDRFLGTLPEDHFHCAELSVGALYLALADAAPDKT
ncbi:MAG: iron-sulfur cluster assembly scaffold protein [Desulfobacula sp.]|nr:iron-sulfur cluster assembly scaffold protein [Desulfobacula sp.]